MGVLEGEESIGSEAGRGRERGGTRGCGGLYVIVGL